MNDVSECALYEPDESTRKEAERKTMEERPTKIVYDVEVFHMCANNPRKYVSVCSKKGYSSSATAKRGATTIVHHQLPRIGMCHPLRWCRYDEGRDNEGELLWPRMYEGYSFLNEYKVSIVSRQVDNDFV